jgi:hypothetical protein
VSAAGFGKAAPTTCSWYMYIKDGKFVLFPSKKPLAGKLIQASLAGS